MFISRRFSKPGSTQLNCFSPPVMLATFAIETVLALYTLWRYKLDSFARLAVAMLGFLALFQLSEYFVCGGMGLTAEHWARTGYVAITMLPPLGLHMLYLIMKRPGRRLVYAAYASAAAFIAFFLGYGDAFTGYQCTGNYVIFQLATHSGMLYGMYYYGWLLAVLVLGWRWTQRLKPTKANLPSILGARALMVGYLVFLVPTAIANTVKPETRRGIPSIMCGFAVLFAVILTVYILPKVARKRSAK